MEDVHNLGRFVEAQGAVYPSARTELAAGRKAGHWMWFIFPQIEGLGHSQMSRRYAIRSLAEAEAYLAHPVLGARLLECTLLLLQIEGRSISEILGSPDDIKFRSCMTLFGHACPENKIFRGALEKYFGGEPDSLTLARLATQ
jgi:uncharacterized protein (DUF1810 family)